MLQKMNVMLRKQKTYVNGLFHKFIHFYHTKYEKRAQAAVNIIILHASLVYNYKKSLQNVSSVYDRVFLGDSRHD